MLALAGAIYASTQAFIASQQASTQAFIASQQAAKSAFDASMVRVGVGILSADPSKSDVAPARQWAIDLVEKHSGQPFNEQDRANLLHHPLLVRSAAGCANGTSDVQGGGGRALIQGK
jgi:hypothetical protein